MQINDYFRWQSGKTLVSVISFSFVHYLYSLLSFLYCYFCVKDSAGEMDSIDVLMLHRPKNPDWVDDLVSELVNLNVVALRALKDSNIFRSKSIRAPFVDAPFEYYMHAAYACFLIKKFKPKVIVIDANGATYTPFLRRAVNSIGGYWFIYRIVFQQVIIESFACVILITPLCMGRVRLMRWRLCPFILAVLDILSLALWILVKKTQFQSIFWRMIDFACYWGQDLRSRATAVF